MPCQQRNVAAKYGRTAYLVVFELLDVVLGVLLVDEELAQRQ